MFFHSDCSYTETYPRCLTLLCLCESLSIFQMDAARSIQRTPCTAEPIYQNQTRPHISQRFETVDGWSWRRDYFYLIFLALNLFHPSVELAGECWASRPRHLCRNRSLHRRWRHFCWNWRNCVECLDAKSSLKLEWMWRSRVKVIYYYRHCFVSTSLHSPNRLSSQIPLTVDHGIVSCPSDFSFAERAYLAFKLSLARCTFVECCLCCCARWHF